MQTKPKRRKVNKFRASYSTLNTWASGNWEKAIKMYFKLETFTSPAMEEGKAFHKIWAFHIEKNKTTPPELGSIKLINPVTEIKKTVNIHDWLDLVGVIDCYDKPTIYEWKTGKTSSESYASSQQAGVYGVLATLSGLFTDRAKIYRYDQQAKKSDVSTVWITDQVLKDSLNWIETLSSEIHNYFTENKLYEKYYTYGKCDKCGSLKAKSSSGNIYCVNTCWLKK